MAMMMPLETRSAPLVAASGVLLALAYSASSVWYLLLSLLLLMATWDWEASKNVEVPVAEMSEGAVRRCQRRQDWRRSQEFRRQEWRRSQKFPADAAPTILPEPVAMALQEPQPMATVESTSEEEAVRGFEEIFEEVLGRINSVRTAAGELHPVVSACVRGDSRTLQRLLSQGANPNGRDDDGVPAIAQAIAHSQIDCVRTLLEGHADVNATTRTGQSALMRACALHELAMIRLLCAYGASRDAVDAEGSTVEDYARGDMSSWQAYTTRQNQVLVWLGRTVEYQPLHLIEEMTRERVAELLRSRADVHALTSRTTGRFHPLGLGGPITDHFTPLSRAREIVRHWNEGLPAAAPEVGREAEPVADALTQRGFEAAQHLCLLADAPWTVGWLHKHSGQLSRCRAIDQPLRRAAQSR
jgi:hypothetical protein